MVPGKTFRNNSFLARRGGGAPDSNEAKAEIRSAGLRWLSLARPTVSIKRKTDSAALYVGQDEGVHGRALLFAALFGCRPGSLQVEEALRSRTSARAHGA